MTDFGLKDGSSYKNGSKLNKGKMCTAASLFSTSVTADKLCVFRSGKHESSNCFKAQKLPFREKLKILKDKGCCFKCLKAGHRQLLSYGLFGGERINEDIHNVYKIELCNLDGNFNCNFDVVDEDIICNDVPSISFGPWIDELKSKNVQMFDIEDNLGPIDVLIGADVAGRLFAGKRRVLYSGLVALESYLGWTIMGKTNLPSEKEDTAMMVISMFVREATISDLFSLEGLGISDPAEMKLKGSTSAEEEIEEAEFDSDSQDLTDDDGLHAPDAHEKESTSFEDERKEQLIAETLEGSENEELQIPEGSNEEMIRLGIVDKESITEKEETTSEEELEEKEDEEKNIDTIPDERKLLEEIVEELKSETDRHGLTEEERHQIRDEIEQHTEIPKVPPESVNPLTPSGPQNLTTFVYGGFVDIWIREMDSSAFSPFLLTVGGRKPTGA
ncbi:hypothetical protein AVEN_98633-1 [Araneus ventricosus]|uniref:Peptidase aspartic putative domain-containing protein n=1 Tax=Araneus ventricosus TaxID=182803 RepID=A0A4Y2WZZ7_ARAVE|nr:hypothetical protein AVEN_98633-1 [Araneus ventricosus]